MNMKVLLINENFNFRNAFITGITQQGIEVVDFFSSPLTSFQKTNVDKVLNYFYYKVKKDKNYYKRQYAIKRETSLQERILELDGFYDYILVFRADLLSTQQISLLRKMTKSLIAYQYDGMSICQNLVSNIHLFDDIFTFDYHDQKKYNFSSLTNCWFPDDSGEEVIADDLFYIGVGVPDRLDRIEPYTKIDLPTLL